METKQNADEQLCLFCLGSNNNFIRIMCLFYNKYLIVNRSSCNLILMWDVVLQSILNTFSSRSPQSSYTRVGYAVMSLWNYRRANELCNKNKNNNNRLHIIKGICHQRYLWLFRYTSLSIGTILLCSCVNPTLLCDCQRDCSMHRLITLDFILANLELFDLYSASQVGLSPTTTTRYPTRYHYMSH